MIPTASSGINAATTTIVATPEYGNGSGVNHIVQIVRPATGHADCWGGYFLYAKDFNDDTDNYIPTNMAISFVIP